MDIHNTANTKPLSTRPADELDLTKLTRICGEWHPETRAAMEAWPHEYELAEDGWQPMCMNPEWQFGTCYRAKPAPTPNLIGRHKMKLSCDIIADLWEGLSAANDLIATMQGGDPDLWAAFEEAIE